MTSGTAKNTATNTVKNTVHGILRGTAALATAALLAACGNFGLGPSDSNTQVRLSGGSSGSASLLSTSTASNSAGASDRGAVVTLDMVESITVTLERIEALRVDGEGEQDWASLDVTAQEVDLVELPASGIEVARGDLAPGEYRNVRFFLDDETITFSEDVSLGGGPVSVATFEAGVPHPLEIPSADQTGLKVPTATFTVGEDDTTVEIVFDAGESVQTIVLTPRGIRMAPVLTAREPR